MSERNGDRARFQKNRKRKLLHRQRIHALADRMQKRVGDKAVLQSASLAMQDEGGPARDGD